MMVCLLLLTAGVTAAGSAFLAGQRLQRLVRRCCRGRRRRGQPEPHVKRRVVWSPTRSPLRTTTCGFADRMWGP